ncbi:Septal ring factor EnvC, activator of murein hydrolases AmiA and AmiB [Azospirillaceae bacterium]
MCAPLFALLIIASGTFARAELPPDQALRQIERGLATGKTRQQELDEQTAKLNAELEPLRTQLVAAADAAARHELLLSTLEASLATLSAEEQDQLRRLTADRRRIAELLAALQRLSRIPPEALIARPETPVNALRSAFLLRAILPPLTTRSQALNEAVGRLQDIRQTLNARRQEAESVRKRLEAQQGEVAALVEKREALRRQTNEERDRIARNMASFAAQASDLRQLIEKVEADRRVEEMKRRTEEERRRQEEEKRRVEEETRRRVDEATRMRAEEERLAAQRRAEAELSAQKQRAEAERRLSEAEQNGDHQKAEAERLKLEEERRADLLRAQERRAQERRAQDNRRALEEIRQRAQEEARRALAERRDAEQRKAESSEESEVAEIESPFGPRHQVDSPHEEPSRQDAPSRPDSRPESPFSAANEASETAPRAAPPKPRAANDETPRPLRAPHIAEQGRLPATGPITVGYGERDQYGAVSRGVHIAARPGASVVSPFSGAIKFSGPFRNYGQILIVEHSNGYHSLIAGLGRIDAAVGQPVSAGEPIGSVVSTNDAADIYFELRRNGQPINPRRSLSAPDGKGQGS